VHKNCGCKRTTTGDLARQRRRRIERPACRAISCISVTCYASRHASLPSMCQIDIMRRIYIVDCCQDAERCLGCAEFTSEGSRFSTVCPSQIGKRPLFPAPFSFGRVSIMPNTSTNPQSELSLYQRRSSVDHVNLNCPFH
jgi:hypothetical protein